MVQLELVCAGTVDTFDSGSLISSVATFVGVNESSVSLALAPASVLAVIEVLGTQDEADAAYSSLSTLTSESASLQFNVSVETITVNQPSLFTVPSPPPIALTEATASSLSADDAGSASLSIAVGGGVVAICLGAAAVVYCVLRRRRRRNFSSGRKLIERDVTMPALEDLSSQQQQQKTISHKRV